MKKAQRKKLQVVELHQHNDSQGRVFGAPHPVDAEHKNKKTQRFHDRTISGYRAWHRGKGV